jgi:KDO2-lipid IV(A) lauroyltransferase
MTLREEPASTDAAAPSTSEAAPRASRVWKWRVEYAGVRCLEALALALPRRVGLALGSALGDLARVLRVRRSTVAANLRYVGIELGDADGGLPELYRNMGKYLVDLLRAPRRPPPYRLHGGELLDRLGERGTVVLMAHFGNFELLASVFGASVKDLHVIVKTMHNPYVERWLSARRLATGVHPLSHQKAASRGLAILRRKGILAALVDQYPGRDGTPVPFLGRQALTVRAIAGLQVRTQASVLGAFTILGPDDVYDVVLAAPPTTSTADVAAAQCLHNDVIGAWVKKHPTHWFGWFHRRFRPYLGYV